MGDYKRIITLALIMAVATAAVLGVTFGILYNTAFEEQRTRLVNMAQSTARMMEAVARFDKEQSADYPKGAVAATISQIKASHQEFEGFGETGEFTLARREGDQIIFILGHRHHDFEELHPVPFDASDAEPMRRALIGLSGTMVGRDYRGKTVLAAYEPVAILDLGIVAKIDLVEIRAPFVKAGGIVVALAVLLIAIGTLLFYRLGEPLIRALRLSREQYRAIVQEHPEMLCRFLPDGTLTFVNDAYCRFFGKSREELVGRTFATVVVQEDLEEVEKKVETLNTNDPVTIIKNRVIAADGEIRWTRWANQAIYDDEGHIIEYQSGGHDITEQVRAQEELSQSEARLSFLITSSPAVIYTSDVRKDYAATYVSPNIEGLMGLKPEDILAEPNFWANRIHPDDAPRVFKDLEHLFKQGKHTHDYRFQKADGSFIWVHDTLNLIYGDDGEPKEIIGSWADITERKLAEGALRESEAQFRDFAEVAADWFWEMDADLCFASFSEQTDQKIGIDTETIIGKQRWEVANADLGEKKWAKHKADLEAHRDFRNFEYSIIDNEGRRRYMQASGKAVFDADENFLGYRGTGRDITALREKTKAVELLQRVATASNESTSIEEALQVCLDEVCAYTGWPVGHVYLYDEDAEELFPSMFWHIDDPERFSAFRQITEVTICKSGIGLPGCALANKEPVWIVDVTKDDNFPRAKKKQIGVKTGFAFPVFVGKQVAAVLEFYTDKALEPDSNMLSLMNNIGTQLGRVMERERAERGLRQSGEMTRTLLSSTGQGIFAVDLNGICTICNPAAVKLLGFDDTTNLQGQNMHPLICHTHADGTPYPESECRIIQAYREKDGLIVDDEVFWRADGTSFPVEYRAYPLHKDAEIIGAVVTFDDISARLETDNKLKQAQKMDAIGHMVGGIAHDFNNLLGIVIGNLELLQRLVGDQEKANTRVETALKGAKRGASLTKKLLSFSRQETVGAEVQNVNQLILNSHDLLDKLLVETTKLKIDLADDLWPAAVDGDDFDSAIMNLCVNARDAMADGGKIVIETGNRHLDADFVTLNPGAKVGDYVQVSLSDTGRGMAPEVVEHIFEPFFTTKERGKGTGLGMSMVYGFVKRSGGYIKVHSQVGHGTTIKVYLPRVHGAEVSVTKADIPETTAELPHGKETVLVVDDEEDLVDLAVEQLEDLGYRTFATINGVEAMKILSSRKKIDLLFTDIVMPGEMDGYDLVLKALKKRPKLKVLLTSGYTARREESAKYVDNPVISELAESLLNKPYTKTELANRIRRALDRED